MVLDRIQDLASVGYLGSIYINDTNAHTGVWRKIYIVSETVFATLTDALMSGTPTGVAFPAGAVITGNFTTIDLTSGAVIAYK